MWSSFWRRAQGERASNRQTRHRTEQAMPTPSLPVASQNASSRIPRMTEHPAVTHLAFDLASILWITNSASHVTLTEKCSFSASSLAALPSRVIFASLATS